MRAKRVKFLREKFIGCRAKYKAALNYSHFRIFKKLYVSKGLDYAIENIYQLAKKQSDRIKKETQKIEINKYNHKLRNIHYSSSHYAATGIKKVSYWKLIIDFIKAMLLLKKARA